MREIKLGDGVTVFVQVRHFLNASMNLSNNPPLFIFYIHDFFTSLIVFGQISKSHTHTRKCCSPTQLQECSYGEGGLGCRVWGASELLARFIVSERQLVMGASVLELGAGVGLVGLTASQLGAKLTVLTEAPLPALLDCLAAGAAAAGVSSGAWQWRNSSGGAIRVASLLWEDDESQAEKRLPTAAGHRERTILGDQLRRTLPPCSAPKLAPSERFGLIVASDCLYDASHCRLLPAVLHARLQPRGQALLQMTLREGHLLSGLIEGLVAKGLVATVLQRAAALPEGYDALDTAPEEGGDSDVEESEERTTTAAQIILLRVVPTTTASTTQEIRSS